MLWEIIGIALLFAVDSQSKPIESSDVCANQPDETYIASPTSEHHFYICTNGTIESESTCFGRLFFDQASQGCVYSLAGANDKINGDGSSDEMTSWENMDVDFGDSAGLAHIDADFAFPSFARDKS